MPRLIAAIIRHGEYRQRKHVPSAHQPYPLTETGKQQAHQAAEALHRQIIVNGWELCPVVDSAQLLRAWQTAKIISDDLIDYFPRSPELTGFDVLAERGLGSAANLTVGEIEKIIHNDPRFEDLPADWKSNSTYRLPLQGAESLLQAGERVAAHLLERMASLGKNASRDTLKLFVGHGAAFRHAAYHLGILEFGQIAQLSMYHAAPIYLEYLLNGSWQHIGGEWKVRGEGGEHTD